MSFDQFLRFPPIGRKSFGEHLGFETSQIDWHGTDQTGHYPLISATPLCAVESGRLVPDDEQPLFAAGAARMPSDELRCTFLAFGHGGCIVIEMPGGRAILYDSGSLAGPDVMRRHISPFPWHRGILRIDEVVFSHADLDHLNGIVDLLDRFAIDQATCTPTFADKPAPDVRQALRIPRERGIPMRIVKAGDRLTVGDVVLEVLHPPAAGPEGNENARSLVLLVRHAGHAILLTGDLEGKGLQHVVGELPPRRVEVLKFLAKYLAVRFVRSITLLWLYRGAWAVFRWACSPWALLSPAQGKILFSPVLAYNTV